MEIIYKGNSIRVTEGDCFKPEKSLYFSMSISFQYYFSAKHPGFWK